MSLSLVAIPIPIPDYEDFSRNIDTWIPNIFCISIDFYLNISIKNMVIFQVFSQVSVTLK